MIIKYIPNDILSMIPDYFGPAFCGELASVFSLDIFKTNDTTETRIHKNDVNLLQIIFQIICGYFEDDCADELSYAPVLTAILGKNRLASQPTLSRFFNRMDNDTLEQFYQLQRKMRKIVYDIKNPDIVILDLQRRNFINNVNQILTVLILPQ